MQKFPLLNLYRALMVLLGIAALLGGGYFAYSASSFRGQIEIVNFLVTFSPFLFIGAIFLVSAELINVLVRIENHLDIVRYESVRGNKAKE